MSELKSKGIKAFAWDLVGKLFTHGAGFIVTVFLARLLEPSDFGLIAMIMVVVGIAQVFTDIGLSGALIQRRRVLSIHYSSVFYFNITIAFLLTCVTFLSAIFIASFYQNSDLIPLVQAISPLFILNALSSVQTTRLRKLLNYALLTKINFVASVLSGMVGIILAIRGAGVWSLVAQVLCQGLFYNLMLWKVSSWVPSITFSFKALKQLWGFGFRMFLANVLDAIFTRIDFLIFGKIFPVSTLGYFQRAKQFNALVIQYSSGSLMSVMYPILSKVQNDLPRFQNIILKSLNILCFVVFLLLGGLYLTSHDLIIFLFSEKWLPSVQYMELLVLSGFGIPISSLLVNVLSSRGNSKAFLKLELLKKSLHTMNFINAYFNGIEMYLYGLVVVSFLGVSLNIVFVAKEISMDIFSFFNPILTQMCIGIISTLCVYQVSDILGLTMGIGFLMKSFMFILLFVLINLIMKTKSIYEIFNMAHPMIKNKFRF